MTAAETESDAPLRVQGSTSVEPEPRGREAPSGILWQFIFWPSQCCPPILRWTGSGAVQLHLLSPSNCPWQVRSEWSGLETREGVWAGRWVPLLARSGLVRCFPICVVEGWGRLSLLSCVICVDRRDGDVSSSNYTQESDLFQNTKATGGIN